MLYTIPIVFKQIFVLVVFITIFAFPEAGRCADEIEKSCATTECHTNMIDNANVHPVESSCSECHEQKSGDHPNPETIDFNLKQTCIECHSKTLDYDMLHSPAAAEACNICHYTHGKKGNNYLHEQKNTICYNCHTEVIKDNETILHSDSSKLECRKCHNIHGSYYPKLLRGNYSTSFFNDYLEENYELCFRCHKIDLLLHPKTSYNTKFRNGKNNLHFLHVNKKNKGRACKSCHKIHASQKEHLMADIVYFGNWQMPVNYISTKNGGKCSPGCHAPQTYDRTIKM